MSAALVRRHLVVISALLLAVAEVVVGQQTGIRAPLLAPRERKAAPDFALRDASGKTATLRDYHGKVLLLDFWATWCTGCKKEIPWFTEFQKLYGPTGFAVVGVSMDEEGWKVLKPFLENHPIPYRILLGNQETAEQFGITNMPDTFLIDQEGRIAAAYRAGLVDKDDVEANIRVMLSKR
jgi:cytochrome c biogenesis protein CcmG/thiol:disulfide interchange protein DsbE